MTRCVFLFFLLSPVPLFAQAEPKPQPLVFTHVTVIDGTGTPPQPDLTVLVIGDRIAAVGKADQVAVPQGARVEDAAGKFLIPGLWDMHTHLTAAADLALCLANGVTGVRDMFNLNPLLPLQQWSRETAAGTRLGPRIVAAHKVVDGPQPVWPWPASVAVGTPAEARAAVRSLKAQGVDFIKVYEKLPRAAYFALAEEARAQGIPFAGHVPFAVSAAEASDAGQKSIEHLAGVLLGCAPDEDALRREAEFPVGVRAQIKSLDHYSDEKARALFQRFARNGTWHCPTLTVWRGSSFLDDPAFAADPRLKYVTPLVKNLVYPKQRVEPSPELAARKRLFRKYLEVVRAMHRAGVELLTGTDTPNAYCFPGFSVHDELELLVRAGLTPMAALQTATRNPARYLDQLARLGTVEPGKLADLVLLEANPLDDIRHTRKIAGVMIGGRWLPKGTLQKLLVESEVQAPK